MQVLTLSKTDFVRVMATFPHLVDRMQVLARLQVCGWTGSCMTDHICCLVLYMLSMNILLLLLISQTENIEVRQAALRYNIKYKVMPSVINVELHNFDDPKFIRGQRRGRCVIEHVFISYMFCVCLLILQR